MKWKLLKIALDKGRLKKVTCAPSFEATMSSTSNAAPLHAFRSASLLSLRRPLGLIRDTTRYLPRKINSPSRCLPEGGLHVFHGWPSKFARLRGICARGQFHQFAERGALASESNCKPEKRDSRFAPGSAAARRGIEDRGAEAGKAPARGEV